jgi:hypothetical protein
VRVRVKDLKPNPFRNIDRYPIDREKVEALKTSIGETDFWDNLLARKNAKGQVEIAYGHHRLEALKGLGIEEVDIPVRGLSDAQMLKMMAEENLDQWRPNTTVNNETVLAARDYLDGELKRYKTWDAMRRANKIISSLIDGEKGFRSAKGQGVGQTTILKFLGGNWRQWMVQDALAAVADESIDRAALEQFDAPAHAEAFRRAVKEHEDLFPRERQATLAAHVKGELAKPDREETSGAIAAEVQRAAHAARKDAESLPSRDAKLRREVETLRTRAEDLISTIDRFKKKALEWVDDRAVPLLKLGQEAAESLSRFSQECERMSEQEPQRSRKAEPREGLIDRAEFLRVLKLLQHGLSPIWGMAQFAFRGDRITTYNERVCLSASFPTGVTGALIGELALKVVSRMAEPHLRITQGDGEVLMSSGGAEWGFATHDNTDPRREKEIAELMLEDRDWTTLPPDFTEALRAVRFSVPEHSPQPPETQPPETPPRCIFFRDRHAFSYDGARASRFTLRTALPEPFLLPAPSADILLRLPRFGPLAVDRYCIEKKPPRCWMHLRGDRLLFSTELIAEDYPTAVAALFETRPPPGMIELPKGLEKDVERGWHFTRADPSPGTDVNMTLRFEGRKVTAFARGKEGSGSPHFEAEHVLHRAVEESFTLEVPGRYLCEALRRFRVMSPPYATPEGTRSVAFHSKGFRHLVVLAGEN